MLGLLGTAKRLTYGYDGDQYISPLFISTLLLGHLSSSIGAANMGGKKTCSVAKKEDGTTERYWGNPIEKRVFVGAL